jgi:hypothetical protein
MRLLRYHDHDSDSQPPAPDVTEMVMSRLGFEQQERSTVRRERIGRHGARVGGFLLLVLVMLSGTLWDQAARDGGVTATLPASMNESKGMRAQALSGLLAPFERLEVALDSTIYSWGTAERSDVDREMVDPTLDVPAPAPLDEGNAVAPFPCS